MAEILSFRALRYNTDRIRLPEVVTEPYDKITAGMRQDYLRRSPFSACRLILPDGDGPARYRNAAELLRTWKAEGVLAVDDRPALTLYRQRFPSPFGGTQTRAAVIAAVELETPGDGSIFAHERTLAGPREDRLNLARATGHHLGPVFMLASPGTALARRLSDAPSDLLDCFDWERDTQHELRTITDREALAGITEAARGAQLAIADGHHRYETALAFQSESDLPGSGHVMAAIAAAEDPGLVVLATHRVVRAGSNASIGSLSDRAMPWFEIRPAASLAEMTEGLKEPGHNVGVCLPDTGFAVWQLRPDADLTSALEGYPSSWASLDVAILHAMILHRLLGIDTREPGQQERIDYVRDAAEAGRRVRQGTDLAAFYLDPTPVSAVLDIALAGTRLPQKSTDFFPKVPSGLAFYDCSIPPGGSAA